MYKLPLPTPRSSRSGAAIVLILILLIVFLIAIAFSVDVARIQLAQIELQSAADLAARAGAEAIARGVGDPNDNVATDSAIRAEVEMVAELNRAGGVQITLAPPTDVVFGTGTVAGLSHSFTPNADGQFNNVTDAIRVRPQLTDFPMFFGAVVDTDTLSLSRRASVVVEERDIVLVLDRSTSMLDHDAGLMWTSAYPANLLSVREDMYVSGDKYYPGGPFANSALHTEFEYAGPHIRLSRSQALQLAVYRFRKEIDKSRGREGLGLVTYAEYADTPAEASVAPGPVDIDAGLSATVRTAIVGNGITKTPSSSPYRHSTERYASAIEAGPDYDSFDFNTLAMRWCHATNVSDGIDKGVDVLFGPGSRQFAQPVLVLMTDGNHNQTQSGTPEDRLAIELASYPKMLVYTVSFGVSADKNLMERLAATGRGKSYHANDVATLVAAFEEIAREAGVTLIE